MVALTQNQLGQLAEGSQDQLAKLSGRDDLAEKSVDSRSTRLGNGLGTGVPRFHLVAVAFLAARAPDVQYSVHLCTTGRPGTGRRRRVGHLVL